MTDDDAPPPQASTPPPAAAKVPPIPPRKKKAGGRGRWVDPIRVHDDIRYGITTFRSISPGTQEPDPPADPDTDPPTPPPRRRGATGSSGERRQR